MITTIWFGKLLRLSTRLTGGGGGSALPGYWIERFKPDFLHESLSQLPQGVIIVTGTNGKTTTTKLIADLLEAYELRVLTNRSGGNFVRGIISTIISRSSWTGHLPYDIAVFEQDEAYAAKFAELYKPRGVVALNVARDQLDRFGEIDKTAELIGQVVAAAKEFVVLNTNDSRIAGLKAKTSGKVIWFGHDKSVASHFVADDQRFSDKPDFYEATKPNVGLINFGDGELDLRINKEAQEFRTSLSGAQNALNVTAAIATLTSILPKVSTQVTAEALTSIQPAFGRGETIKLKSGGQLKLQLVKNPASFSHNLQQLGEHDLVGIVINDKHVDGRDVSWLWDVDFQKLAGRKIICGGMRAYDMANRLKYDEVKASDVELSFRKFVKKLTANSEQLVVIYCTYTAMLKVRKLLKPYASELKGGLHG